MKLGLQQGVGSIVGAAKGLRVLVGLRCFWGCGCKRFGEEGLSGGGIWLPDVR